MSPQQQTVSPSMIIGDFSLVRVSIPPDKANPVLVIDPDGVLPFSIPRQSFQSIPGRKAKVLQCRGGIQHLEFTERDFPEWRRRFAAAPAGYPELPSFLVPET
jgi:hypothetical protein